MPRFQSLPKISVSLYINNFCCFIIYLNRATLFILCKNCNFIIYIFFFPWKAHEFINNFLKDFFLSKIVHCSLYNTTLFQTFIT